MKHLLFKKLKDTNDHVVFVEFDGRVRKWFVQYELMAKSTNTLTILIDSQGLYSSLIPLLDGTLYQVDEKEKWDVSGFEKKRKGIVCFSFEHIEESKRTIVLQKTLKKIYPSLTIKEAYRFIVDDVSAFTHDNRQGTQIDNLFQILLQQDNCLQATFFSSSFQLLHTYSFINNCSTKLFIKVKKEEVSLLKEMYPRLDSLSEETVRFNAIRYRVQGYIGEVNWIEDMYGLVRSMREIEEILRNRKKILATKHVSMRKKFVHIYPTWNRYLKENYMWDTNEYSLQDIFNMAEKEGVPLRMSYYIDQGKNEQ